MRSNREFHPGWGYLTPRAAPCASRSFRPRSARRRALRLSFRLLMVRWRRNSPSRRAPWRQPRLLRRLLVRRRSAYSCKFRRRLPRRRRTKPPPQRLLPRYRRARRPAAITLRWAGGLPKNAQRHGRCVSSSFCALRAREAAPRGESWPSCGWGRRLFFLMNPPVAAASELGGGFADTAIATTRAFASDVFALWNSGRAVIEFACERRCVFRPRDSGRG